MTKANGLRIFQSENKKTIHAEIDRKFGGGKMNVQLRFGMFSKMSKKLWGKLGLAGREVYCQRARAINTGQAPEEDKRM